MTQTEKDELRAKIIADNGKLQDGMAPYYLGKSCPWNGHDECHGPSCSAFLLQQNDQGKIAGGACCIPLIASQVGPVADALMQLAAQMVQHAPRVQIAPAGLVQR